MKKKKFEDKWNWLAVLCLHNNTRRTVRLKGLTTVNLGSLFSWSIRHYLEIKKMEVFRKGMFWENKTRKCKTAVCTSLNSWTAKIHLTDIEDPEVATAYLYISFIINQVIVVDIIIKLFFGLTASKLVRVKWYHAARIGDGVISERSLPRRHSLVLQPLCLIVQMLLRVLKEKLESLIMWTSLSIFWTYPTVPL